MIKINLLPKKEGIQAEKFYCLKTQIPILLGAGITLISWHIILQHKINITTHHIDHLQQELNATTKQTNSDLNQKKQQIEQKTNAYLATLGQKRNKLVQIFTALSQGTPENLCISELLIRNLETKIVGQARSTSDLVVFISRLAVIKELKLSVQKIIKQRDVFNFILLCSY